MPSPSKRKKICIFGDSHIGCVKNALTRKIFTTRRALDFEFWGADGPKFRSLDLDGHRLIPRADALETVLMVNGAGKEVLDPADFDAILFMGARIRTADFFPPLLHRMQDPEGFLSDAVFRQVSLDWLPRNRFYRAAKAMAATQQARIFVAPTSFLGEGEDYLLQAIAPGALRATAEQRQKIWDVWSGICTDDGITLLPQPEETIVNGVMTRTEFGGILSNGEPDPVHRSPEYAAILLQNLVDAFYV